MKCQIAKFSFSCFNYYMNINKISFGTVETKVPVNENSKSKNDYLAMFYDKARNSADLTDAILVPRTIFKGYLGIMSGTTLVTLGALSSKYPKLSKFLSISGLLTSLYGTWSFVRPYILKGSKGVETVETLQKKNNK